MRNIIWKIASVYHTVKVKVKSLSCVGLFATPWTVEPTRLRHPWDFPGKNTGVGCHFLLQGIFTTQGSNPGLLHCRETVWATREADLLVTRYHQFLCFYYGSESFIILFAEFSRTQNLSVGFPRFNLQPFLSFSFDSLNSLICLHEFNFCVYEDHFQVLVSSLLPSEFKILFIHITSVLGCLKYIKSNILKTQLMIFSQYFLPQSTVGTVGPSY